jgi:sugar (pentulose or hexulose) kinase
LPKDFLGFKLTGQLGTDETDAAGSGIFHISQRVWADISSYPARLIPN